MKKKLVHIIPFLSFILLSGLLAIHNGQDLNWDLQNYHYYDGYAFLHNNKNFAIAGIQTYLNPTLDIMVYVLITHLSPMLVGFTLGAIQGLNLFLIYELFLLILPKYIKNQKYIIPVSLILSLFSFVGAINISELGNTMGDNIASIPMLLALLLYLKCLDKKMAESKRNLYMLIPFILIGISVGLKLTNAIYAVGLLVASLFIKESYVNKLKRTTLAILSLLLGYAISGGYWSIYLWNKFKNPIFPYFNKIFQSPYVTSNSNFHDPRWFPHGILHILFYPFYFTFNPLLVEESKFFDLRILLFFICLIFIILLLAKNLFINKNFHFFKNVLAKQIFIFVFLSYVLWEVEFSYFRYIVGLEYLSILVIFITIYEVIKNDGLKWVIMSACCLLFLTTTHFANWGRINYQSSYFNVSIPKNIKLNNSIILTNTKPVGYLVPFFPQNDQFIRIGGSLSTPLDNKIVMKYINKGKKMKKNFYLLTLTENPLSVSANILLNYGFKIGNCYNIKSNVNILYSNNNFTNICALATYQ